MFSRILNPKQISNFYDAYVYSSKEQGLWKLITILFKENIFPFSFINMTCLESSENLHGW